MRFHISLLLIALVSVSSSNSGHGQQSVPFGPAGMPGKALPAETDDFAATATTPLPLLYLETAAVRDELKLTKEQAAKIDRIQVGWSDAAGKGSVEPAVLREKLGKGTIREIDDVLSLEQRARLEQIIVRHRVKEHGMPAVLATLARDLDLTPAQGEKHARLYRKRGEIVLEQLTSGECLHDIRRVVFQANSDYVEQFEKLLSEAQQSKLKTLLGELVQRRDSVAAAHHRQPDARAECVCGRVLRLLYL